MKIDSNLMVDIMEAFNSVTNSGPRSAAKSACGLFFMRRSVFGPQNPSKAMKSGLSIMERMTPIK